MGNYSRVDRRYVCSTEASISKHADACSEAFQTLDRALRARFIAGRLPDVRPLMCCCRCLQWETQ